MLVTSRAASIRIGLVSIAMLVLIVSYAGVNHLNAHGATASIQGTVTDASGGAVPEATVQVRNIGTGAGQTTATDSSGRFTVSDLAVGSYEVEATKSGFSTVVHRGITLAVGS
jgi:hypothetical protein